MNSAHTVGSKYAETQSLRTTEIAKLIRKDIAAAIKAGELPKLTVSVRCGGSSLHSSIDVTVTDAPEGFVVRVPDDQVDWRRANGVCQPWLTDEAAEVERKLRAIVAAYNFDNSDVQTDYFHVRFYEHVRFAAGLSERTVAA